MHKGNNANRRPTYILIGLIITIFIVGYNYYGLSTKNASLRDSLEKQNIEYLNEIKNLKSQLKSMRSSSDVSELNANYHAKIEENNGQKAQIVDLTQRINTCEAKKTETEQKLKSFMNEHQQSLKTIEDKMKEIHKDNEMSKLSCEKHVTDALFMFQNTIINMAKQLGEDDSRKLLKYLNILKENNQAEYNELKKIERSEKDLNNDIRKMGDINAAINAPPLSF